MDIPIAFPIMEDKKSMEEYDLEQKRNELCRAEQDLTSIILSAEDFFDSPLDKEAVLQQIRENPEEIIASSAKPFMKKIARAMLVVASLNNEVDKAFEVVADQQLTPSEVKVQISKALADQRAFLETMMEERMETERARYEKMLLEQETMMEERMETELARYEKILLEQKTLFEHKLTYSEGKLASLSTKMDCLFESQLLAEREQKAFVESQLQSERVYNKKVFDLLVSYIPTGASNQEQSAFFTKNFWKQCA